MESQADSVVITENHLGIVSITLNRPGKANALDLETSKAFTEAIDTVCSDNTVRVIVLKGSGKIFCAGGDIATFTKDANHLPAMMASMLGTLHEAMLKLSSLRVPVISVLNGPVGGGGIGIALCADFVLAAESMKLRGGYSAIGLTPDAGSSWFLTKRAGAALAKEIFFLNRPLDATQCLSHGIVDAVYPDDRLLPEAEDLALRLSRAASGSIARIKHLVDGAHQRTLQEHLALERDYMVVSAASSEAREGISAFMEKRTPVFLKND